MITAQRMGTTERILTKMFKEDTGRHMLDSGGAYGRNFEHNQKIKRFADLPTGSAHVYFYEGKPSWEFSVSTFQFLKEHLDYDAQMQKKFKAWLKKNDPKEDMSYFEAVEKFTAEQADGGDRSTTNTYNYDSLFDQVIQYTEWYDNVTHIALFVHGGCDVRGGYTAPRFFRSDDGALAGDSRCTVYCNCKDRPAWDYESGCDGLRPVNEEGTNLDDYPTDVENKDAYKQGKVYVDEKHVPHCPKCGAELKVSAL
jgi:hypothetical protein